MVYFRNEGVKLVLVDYSEDLLNKSFFESNEENEILLVCDLIKCEFIVEVFSKIVLRFG